MASSSERTRISLIVEFEVPDDLHVDRLVDFVYGTWLAEWRWVGEWYQDYGGDR